jgi:hypothetical protein
MYQGAEKALGCICQGILVRRKVLFDHLASFPFKIRISRVFFTRLDNLRGQDCFRDLHTLHEAQTSSHLTVYRCLPRPIPFHIIGSFVRKFRGLSSATA